MTTNSYLRRRDKNNIIGQVYNGRTNSGIEYENYILQMEDNPNNARKQDLELVSWIIFIIRDVSPFMSFLIVGGSK